MTLKTWWQRRSYWQKGVIITIGINFSVIFFLYTVGLISFFFYDIDEILYYALWVVIHFELMPLSIILSPISNMVGNPLLDAKGVIVLVIVMYGILGALIGYLIGKVKGK